MGLKGGDMTGQVGRWARRVNECDPDSIWLEKEKSALVKCA